MFRWFDKHFFSQRIFATKSFFGTQIFLDIIFYVKKFVNKNWYVQQIFEQVKAKNLLNNFWFHKIIFF